MMLGAPNTPVSNQCYSTPYLWDSTHHCPFSGARPGSVSVICHLKPALPSEHSSNAQCADSDSDTYRFAAIIYRTLALPRHDLPYNRASKPSLTLQTRFQAIFYGTNTFLIHYLVKKVCLQSMIYHINAFLSHYLLYKNASNQ